MQRKLREILGIVGVPVVAASLCCLSPVILVVFGLGSVALAGSLADSFYFDYKWYFRIAGLILLAISLVLYYRKKGVCTLSQVKRRQKEIINTVLLALFAGIVGYIVFLYVVVHYIGVFLNIWK